MKMIFPIIGRWKCSDVEFTSLVVDVSLNNEKALAVRAYDHDDGEVFGVEMIKSSSTHVHFEIIIPSSGYVSENCLTVDGQDQRCSVLKLTYEEPWKRIEKADSVSYSRIIAGENVFSIVGRWRYYDNECASLVIDVSLNNEKAWPFVHMTLMMAKFLMWR